MVLRVENCTNNLYTAVVHNGTCPNGATNIWEQGVTNIQQGQVKPVQTENFKKSRGVFDKFELFPNGEVKTWINSWTGDGYYIKTKYEYDEKGRLIKKTAYKDGYPDSNEVIFVDEYNYEKGKPTTVTTTDYTEHGRKDTFPVNQEELKNKDGAYAKRELKRLKQERQSQPSNFIE